MTDSRSKAQSIESDLATLRDLPAIASLNNFHAYAVGGRRLFGLIWWFQGGLWWEAPTLLVRPLPTLWLWFVTAFKGARYD